MDTTRVMSQDELDALSENARKYAYTLCYVLSAIRAFLDARYMGTDDDSELRRIVGWTSGKRVQGK